MSGSIDTISSGFLIAAPALRDPNFDHTVVLMCVHNEHGAMGLVINRPAPLDMTELMRQLGLGATGPGTRADGQDDENVHLSRAVMIGGPVGLDNGLLLYRTSAGKAQAHEDEIVVSDELRICPNQEILRDIADSRGPTEYHVFLGHAGWSPGQLEREIAQGAWVPARLDLDIIFETPLEDRWEAALAIEGLHPSMLGAFRPHNQN